MWYKLFVVGEISRVCDVWMRLALLFEAWHYLTKGSTNVMKGEVVLHVVV